MLNALSLLIIVSFSVTEKRCSYHICILLSRSTLCHLLRGLTYVCLLICQVNVSFFVSKIVWIIKWLIKCFSTLDIYSLYTFCTLQAFKQGMYGPKYVWILISGRNQDNWWKEQSPLVDCTPEQVRKGLSNNIGTGELKLSPTPGPTKFGKVFYVNQLSIIIDKLTCI